MGNDLPGGQGTASTCPCQADGGAGVKIDMKARLEVGWPWGSRMFWSGLPVAGFLIWLMADSLLYNSAFRKPLPSGEEALVATIRNGAVRLTWYSERNFYGFFSGKSSRSRAAGIPKVLWLPEASDRQENFARVRTVAVPTWLPLAGWLAAWATLSGVEKRRMLSGRQ